MQTVWLANDPFNAASWVPHFTDDIRELLVREYAVWPQTARIYHQHVAKSHDVTPVDKVSVNALAELPGPFYVVVYPAVANVLAAVAIYAVAYIVDKLTTNDKKPREQIFATGSPNNQLSDRTNKIRINERIPDAFGTLRFVPDVIQHPYIVYENHFPVEYSYLCIGRGDIAVSEIRDGDIKIDDIKDSIAVVYPPGNAPAPGGGSPNLVIGGSIIPDPTYSVFPVKSVNGDQLAPFNSFTCYGSGRNNKDERAGHLTGPTGILNTIKDWAPMIFRSDGVIVVPTNGDPDFVTSRIRVGDELQVAWGRLATPFIAPLPDLSAGWAFTMAEHEPHFTGDGFPENGRVDLDPLVVTDVITRNRYEVEVHCTIPGSLAAEWAKISGSSVGMKDDGVACVFNRNASITPQNRFAFGYQQGGLNEQGILVNDPDMTELWMNFVAPSGLYSDDGANRKTINCHIAFFLTPCDANGIATGDPVESGTAVLKGSLISNETRAVTVKFTRVTPGRCRLLVCRTSQRIRQVELDPATTEWFRPTVFQLDVEQLVSNDFGKTAFTGNVFDEVTFANCYSMNPVVFHGPDVTTLHVKTVQNQSAGRVENREINCIATRITGSWNGTVFDPFTPDTQGFGENMLFHIMLDSFIGRRSGSEIDFPGIAAAFQAVRDYFGDEDATRFAYTFDDDQASFEEIVLTLCAACFVVPYRQGSVIKCDPEIATDASTLILNHRNKVPGSETRQVTFGIIGDNDGVEQDYIDVDTGPDTFVPISQSNAQTAVVSPLKSRIVGLSKRHQAAWHAYRQLARMAYQHINVDVECLEEAATLSIKQRVLCEDNTRPDTQDGYITSVTGLVLGTSQPVAFAGGSTYTVFLQNKNGSVELLTATAGPDVRSITLGSAPSTPIIINGGSGVPTTYVLSRNQNSQPKAMMVTDKQHNNRLTWQLSLANYSHMYYHADGLILFLPVSTEIGGEEMFDRSPYGRPNNGTVADTTSDTLRGPVYNGTVGSNGILVDSNIAACITQGYTKACWIKKADGTNRGPILESTTTDAELFEVAGAVVLRAGHNGAFQVAYTNPTSIVAAWIHAAVTYDVIAQIMCLYFNGELVATATGVPTVALGSLTAFRSQNATFAGRLVGQADNLRHYCRVLSPSMIRELYQAELILP